MEPLSSACVRVSICRTSRVHQGTKTWPSTVCCVQQIIYYAPHTRVTSSAKCQLTLQIWVQKPGYGGSNKATQDFRLPGRRLPIRMGYSQKLKNGERDNFLGRDLPLDSPKSEPKRCAYLYWRVFGITTSSTCLVIIPSCLTVGSSLLTVSVTWRSMQHVRFSQGAWDYATCRSWFGSRSFCTGTKGTGTKILWYKKTDPSYQGEVASPDACHLV